jgi:hypothetical protein
MFTLKNIVEEAKWTEGKNAWRKEKNNLIANK